MKKHSFSKAPSKIVWIQVPGLDEEQIAMLRFSALNNAPTSFESAICLGKSWNYNFFDLRTNPENGLLAQLQGTKNVKGQCEDYNQKPVWRYLEEKGFVTGILERGSKNLTFEEGLKCNRDYLSKSIVWSMSKAPSDGELFHFQEKNEFQEGKVYYDKTCQNNECFSGLPKNVEYVWKELNKRQNQTMLIIRDFSYYNALKARDIKKARMALLDIEKIYSTFSSQDLRREFLVVLSSTAARRIEFPKAGKEWFDFEKKGRNISYKKSALMSPVIASGPLSENFCGIYEESSLLERFLWTPQENKLIFEYFGF